MDSIIIIVSNETIKFVINKVYVLVGIVLPDTFLS